MRRSYKSPTLAVRHDSFIRACVSAWVYVCVCVCVLICACACPTFLRRLLWGMTHAYATWLIHIRHDSFIHSKSGVCTESCHMWMSHVTCEWVMLHMYESCHVWIHLVTHEYVISHMALKMQEVMLHSRMSHSTLMTEAKQQRLRRPSTSPTGDAREVMSCTEVRARYAHVPKKIKYNKLTPSLLHIVH